MTDVQEFTLSGTAVPTNAIAMLDEICEHFVEHADVQRSGNRVAMKSEVGDADIRAEDGKLLIELSCPSQEILQMARIMLAEHLFYFAGEDPFELEWSEPAPRGKLANLREAVVVGTEQVTPRMLRVKFACADVSPFLGGDIHVRILVPPKGREPVWPGIREDGRVAWPEGEDELLVRVYTIRAVDAERGELWIDFFQHPEHDIPTPGADFARDARAGDLVGIMGPGGGDVPQATSMLIAGDETALPAIARIAAEAQPGTSIRAIIEVEDAAEEQPLLSAATLDVRWLHRASYGGDEKDAFASETMEAIGTMAADTFIWVACEKEGARKVRKLLKSRDHDRKRMYVAHYWERNG
ncbi:phage tail protein (plasmid) [Rhizobium sp. ACO-34A]|nr:siderophore-interacting protein [Rhizobium sp. ACO-34A]ATN36725.1 phage tail protein [Rhizobium sp. ACO-34A]